MSAKKRLTRFLLLALDVADALRFPRLPGKTREVDDRLRKAILAGDPQGVARLLEKRANPNAIFHDDGRILEIAALSGSPSCLQKLLEGGASPRRCPEALYKAATRSAPRVIEALARHGADIDEPDEMFGWPPVLWAAWHGNLEGVEELERLGADMEATGPGGLDAIQTASKCNEPLVLAWLLARARARKAAAPAVLHTSTAAAFEAARHPDGACLRLLLAEGIAVDARDPRGMTMAMAAACSNAPLCLALLDDAGADFELPSAHVHSQLLFPEAGGGPARSAMEMAAAGQSPDALAWMIARRERLALSCPGTIAEPTSSSKAKSPRL